MSDRWHLNPLAAAAWRQWDGETVVHHGQSNDTHRLAEPAGLILSRLLADGALATHEIAAGSPFDIAELSSALDGLSGLTLVVQC